MKTCSIFQKFLDIFRLLYLQSCVFLLLDLLGHRLSRVVLNDEFIAKDCDLSLDFHAGHFLSRQFFRTLELFFRKRVPFGYLRRDLSFVGVIAFRRDLRALRGVRGSTPRRAEALPIPTSHRHARA